jgi:ribosomal protein S18 acetylase RimI-like enzyme
MSDAPTASAIAFVVADPVQDHEILLTLNIEYVGWVFREIERTFGTSMTDITGLPLSEYVARNLPKVFGDGSARNVFYLLQYGEDIAGMGGLRFLRPGVAEIKRLYVRPAFRGRNLGKMALEQLLADAHRLGYKSVCLDTGSFMDAAHRLYESHGFHDCPAYEGVEVPAAFHARWRFMERPVSETPDP